MKIVLWQQELENSVHGMILLFSFTLRNICFPILKFPLYRN